MPSISTVVSQDLSIFSFQSIENSVQVRVALLLYTALTHHANLMGVSTSEAVDHFLNEAQCLELPAARNYFEFIKIVKQCHRQLPSISTVVSQDLSMFSFQSNENSVQVRVALLLYTALTHHANLMGISTSEAVDHFLNEAQCLEDYGIVTLAMVSSRWIPPMRQSS